VNSWNFDGMSTDSTLASVDNDARFLAIAQKYMCAEQRQLLVEAGLIDDMLPQPNWPEGPAEKVGKRVADLESRDDFEPAIFVWAKGIIIAMKR
jgi:hypothetical protein